MVTLRKRVRTEEAPSNPKQGEERSSSKSYEQSRDERIKENMLRMQKLGIFEISQKLKSEFVSPKRLQKRTFDRKSSTPTATEPPRRSARLQNINPVSYVEVHKCRNEKPFWNQEISLRKGPMPEIYTEEHEKLLGTCHMSWTLFQDGHGADGKRIYDPVNGKTCHQCRQKTLGHRTHCSKCQLVQGQLCGDCLYMRYGEHVLEAKNNLNWVCPVCRDICNCSCCRIRKGWAPTGPLYAKILSLGYKSVAHYLIQTHRAPSDAEDSVPEHPVSAKRSLPFTNAEDTNTNDCGMKLKRSDSHSASSIMLESEATLEKMLVEMKLAVPAQSTSGGNSNVGSGGNSKFGIKHLARRPSLKNKHKKATKPTVISEPTPDCGSTFASESEPKPIVIREPSSDGVCNVVLETKPEVMKEGR